MSPGVEWTKQNLGLPVVVCPDFAMHGWFSHPGSPQTKSSVVRASASGAVAGTSAGAGTRTVYADRSSIRSGWNIDEPCCQSVRTGRHRCGLCTTARKRRDRAWNRSSCLSRRHVLPVAMDHACTWALYLLHLRAARLHKVRCGTLVHLLCCWCCAVVVPVPVLKIAARFHHRR